MGLDVWSSTTASVFGLECVPETLSVCISSQIAEADTTSRVSGEYELFVCFFSDPMMERQAQTLELNHSSRLLNEAFDKQCFFEQKNDVITH